MHICVKYVFILIDVCPIWALRMLSALVTIYLTHVLNFCVILSQVAIPCLFICFSIIRCLDCLYLLDIKVDS